MKEKLKLFARCAGLVLTGKIVKSIDIADSYSRIADNYDRYFMSKMRMHNDTVLEHVCKAIPEKLRYQVIDLGCGTGYNTQYLQANLPKSDYYLVDTSEKMLQYAENSVNRTRCHFINSDMLKYLKSCPDESADIIVCNWAIMYKRPKRIIKECSRIMKKRGVMAVAVSTKNSFPEVWNIYSELLTENIGMVNKYMRKLHNPRSGRQLQRWFVKNGFKPLMVRSGSHSFKFKSAEKLTNFITGTGALAGFDIMLDLNSESIKKQITAYFDNSHIDETTYKFVYGIFRRRY